MAQVNGQFWPLGQIAGTLTNDSAAAGFVGEYISSAIALGTPTSLTNATAKSIANISLTPGDWDVWADVGFTGNAATTVTILYGSISTTNDAIDATNGRFGALVYATGGTIFAQSNPVFAVGPMRVSIASTTTYYLVEEAFFGVNTCSGYGIIQARRKR